MSHNAVPMALLGIPELVGIATIILIIAGAKLFSDWSGGRLEGLDGRAVARRCLYLTLGLVALVLLGELIASFLR